MSYPVVGLNIWDFGQIPSFLSCRLPLYESKLPLSCICLSKLILVLSRPSLKASVVLVVGFHIWGFGPVPLHIRRDLLKWALSSLEACRSEFCFWRLLWSRLDLLRPGVKYIILLSINIVRFYFLFRVKSHPNPLDELGVVMGLLLNTRTDQLKWVFVHFIVLMRVLECVGLSSTYCRLFWSKLD